MRHIFSKTLICAAALILACVGSKAQNTIDLLNYNACSITYYDWDYGTTDGLTYGWILSQRYQPDGTRHKIITKQNSQVTDPNIPITDLAPGESTTLRLGTADYNTVYGQDQYGNVYVDQTEMAKGGGVIFTYKVTQENAIMLIKYATMLTDPMQDHYTAMTNLIGQQAWNEGYGTYSYIGDAALFEYSSDWEYQQPMVHFALGIDGNDLACSSRYQVLYDDVGNAVILNDSWQSISFDVPDQMVYYHYDAFYKPWSTIAIDLTPYIGHNVSFYAEYKDCAMAGWYFFEEDTYYQYPQIFTCDDHHLARLYLHASCAPAGDGTSIPSALYKVGECDNGKVTYSAPEGFTSYKWFSSNNRSQVLSTSQTCDYTFADGEQDVYLFCTVTSPMTSNCTDESTTLSLHLSNDCAAPEIEEIDRTCNPLPTVTCKAPAGYVAYRWFTADDRSASLGTNLTYTVEFTQSDETVYLFCEMTSASGTKVVSNMLELVNDCQASELTYLSQECDPQMKVTYMAPDGYVSYRWFSANDRTNTLSVTSTCSVVFTFEGEEVDLFCEMTTKGGNTNLANVHIINPCVNGNSSKLFIPYYICADSKTLTLQLNYTEGAPLSYDIVFDEAAKQAGFQDAQNVPIKQTGNPYQLEIPVPKTAPYVRPDYYKVNSITIHQQYDKDTTFKFGFYVYYPDWVLHTKWNDVIAVKNYDNNGNYNFSAIRWYTGTAAEGMNFEGKTIDGQGDLNSYIYIGPDATFAEGAQYWAELTRADDGKTFCTCPVTPNKGTPQEAPARSSEITLTPGSDGADNLLLLSAQAAGSYTVYNMLGLWMGSGSFAEGETTLSLRTIPTGTYLFVFRLDNGNTETRKVIINNH